MTSAVSTVRCWKSFAQKLCSVLTWDLFFAWWYWQHWIMFCSLQNSLSHTCIHILFFPNEHRVFYMYSIKWILPRANGTMRLVDRGSKLWWSWSWELHPSRRTSCWRTSWTLYRLSHMFYFILKPIHTLSDGLEIVAYLFTWNYWTWSAYFFLSF